MNIICPHCNFSKTVDPAQVPDRPVKVSCPKCKKRFTFDKKLEKGEASANTATPQKDSLSSQAGGYQGRRIICNACGTVQPPAARCVQCGATIIATASPLNEQSYAGFWVRVLAYLLDSVLLITVQTALSLLINLTIGMLGIATEGDPAINTIIWLFGAVLSISYAVFFTGYCGQTPGKMVLRIKVIRTDGSPINYGRAALREVLGKFISSILLGIGYLMVAFDNRKQGLHDKIADTYVIKL
ncbi:RDD family protein [Deltaproteobacteria bacterium IMCC39524]|nr:RDD family protein [Deltaproteobacteria bacterium IMCC39524]